MYYLEYPWPLGTLLLCSDGEALTGLCMQSPPPPEAVSGGKIPVLQQTAAWLDAYFRGENPPMQIRLKPEGTAFQRLVWQLLLEIPYGESRTYGQLAALAAAKLGRANMAPQAIGGAVGSNPISILIPCHRVLGSGGAITGYAGGLAAKAFLLQHEKIDFA